MHDITDMYTKAMAWSADFDITGTIAKAIWLILKPTINWFAS